MLPLLVPLGLAAQTVATPLVLVGGESTPGPSGAGTQAVIVAPEVGVRSSRLVARANATLGVGGNLHLLRDAAVSARLPVLRLGRWGGEVNAAASVTQPTPTGARWSAASLEFGVRRGDSVAGYRLAAGLARHANSDRGVLRPAVRAGVWLRPLGIVINAGVGYEALPETTTGVGTPSDTLAQFGADTLVPQFMPGQTTTTRRVVYATDAMINATGTVAGMELNGTVGAFFVGGAGARPFGSLTFTRWLSDNVGATFGASRRILDAVTGSSVTNAVFGVKLGMRPSRHPPASDPDAALAALVASRSGDSVTVAFRAPGAARVAMRGDLTGWQAVTLQRAEGDWWHAVLAVEPGVYHVDVRIDGHPWAAPPGLPHVADPYAGDVAVVIVP